MLALHPEYVIDEYHKPKAVLLPFNEWQQILESLEDSDDVHVYDEAKTKELSFIPFEQAIEEIQSGKIE